MNLFLVNYLFEKKILKKSKIWNLDNLVMRHTKLKYKPSDSQIKLISYFNIPWRNKYARIKELVFGIYFILFLYNIFTLILRSVPPWCEIIIIKKAHQIVYMMLQMCCGYRIKNELLFYFFTQSFLKYLYKSYIYLTLNTNNLLLHIFYLFINYFGFQIMYYYYNKTHKKIL